jgi:cyclopropane fatty-acyl-phospholipid synthase-like methyltransferase
MSEVPGFSKAADNNKGHILEQLKACLKAGDRVLEIASGTAQHALHFSKHLPDVFWQPSDVDLETYNLAERLLSEPRDNLGEPLQLDVSAWPNFYPQFEAVYSANCLHIIDWSKVENYIEGAAKCLTTGGALLFYGPFKYGEKFTTDSNEKFNGFLETTYSGGGIRDFEAVDELAAKQGLTFVSDTPMPANNQFLIWRK